MKTIYIRAGIAPFRAASIPEVIQKNLIGQNSGNLIYQYSVFRALAKPDVAFDVRYESAVYNTPGAVERLNAEADMAVLPLANAFRPSFPLKPLTDMVRRLTIPCVVIGCGLQAKRPEDIKGGFPFDDDARAFVSAVLDKSAMLGLRGEYTAEYLKRLGFVPEKHFTVIGCPSLFMNGSRLPAPKPLSLSGSTRLSINTLTVQNPALNGLIADAEARYPDYHLVLQEQRELAMIAFGTVNGAVGPGLDATGFYPLSPRHRDVLNGRAVGFTEARAWFDFLRGVDLSFGSRLHGNLAAVVSGTPAFVFTSDVRTEEICRYANIPHMPVEAVREGMTLESAIEGADFAGVCRGYDRRFAHFLDFLEANGVDHIYRDDPAPGEAHLDRLLADLPAGGVVRRGCVPAGRALGEQLSFYGKKLARRGRRTVSRLLRGRR